MSRLAAGIWVSAYLTRLRLADIPAFVTSKGDETAGAVLVKSNTLDGQARLTGLLGQPLTLVAVLALAYGAWLLLTIIWLNVVTGRRRLRPAQALSLAVWCRWGWLPLMVVSLLLGSIDAGLATVLAPTVLGVGLLIEVVAGYKMMWDLQAVTYAPPARAVLLGFGLPFLLAVAGLIALGVTSSDEVGFLWHLATRG